jgi:hypothetical protein
MSEVPGQERKYAKQDIENVFCAESTYDELIYPVFFYDRSFCKLAHSDNFISFFHSFSFNINEPLIGMKPPTSIILS